MVVPGAAVTASTSPSSSAMTRSSRLPTSRRESRPTTLLFSPHHANRHTSGAGVSTTGLWHYPATVVNSNDTIEFAQFEAAGQWTTKTTAGVINNFEGRQQMAFFISWATEWAIASNFLQHTWIHWMTRGICKSYLLQCKSVSVSDVLDGAKS